MSGTGHGVHWRETVQRWVKFNTVGAIGVGVQLGTLTVLIAVCGLNYLTATALAVETAVLHNFLWHDRWTWADRTRSCRSRVAFRLLRFNVTTGLVSILGNLVLMHLLVGRLHLPYLPANVLTIGTCSLANFLASDRLVFQPSVFHTSWQRPIKEGECTS